jgi:hypothetical protein
VPAPVDISYIKGLATTDVDYCRYSILDLCLCHSFTLLVESGNKWQTYFPLLQDSLRTRNIELRLFAAGKDFEFTDDHHRELYAQNVFSGSEGGLLVRPDQHILMRFDANISVRQIELALLEYLGF